MWKCRCIICRALVHPIISRVSPVISYQTDLEVMKTSPPEVEEVSKVVQVTTPSEQLKVRPTSEEVIPSKPQEVPQQGQQPSVVEVKIPPELVEQMSKLESEINTLRGEIASLNDGIKSVILEFKEVIAEVSSPFNLLRGSTHSSRNGNGNGTKKAEASIHHKLTPTSFFELLNVVYSMLSRLSKDQVRMLVEGYVKSGMVGEDVGRALVGIVELADDMRRAGLSLEEHLPYLFSMLTALNVKDQSLNDYVLRELIRRGKIG